VTVGEVAETAVGGGGPSNCGRERLSTVTPPVLGRESVVRWQPSRRSVADAARVESERPHREAGVCESTVGVPNGHRSMLVNNYQVA